MDNPSKTLRGTEIVEAISRANREEIQKNYYKIIHTMQARMSADQEAFK